MNNIPQVARVIQTVLSVDTETAARETRFVQRHSKITGQVFVKALVFGWLANPCATLTGLAEKVTAFGVSITPQGLDQRFTEQAAAFLRRILNAVVAQVVTADPVAIPILRRFNGVVVQDSTTICLPAPLSEVWVAGGGNVQQNNSAVKLQVRVDLLTGSLVGPLLQDGCRHDHSSPLQAMLPASGALWLADLGYFSLDVLQDMDKQGTFFLSRLQVQTMVTDEDGIRLDLLALLRTKGQTNLDMLVRIGAAHRLRVRLLAVRVSEEVANERRRKLHAEARHKGQKVSEARLNLADWTILITNAPEKLLPLQDALVLIRVRWQIELIFKLWKQHGRIDEWRSGKQWRILCEVYAKLIAMVIQHWLFLVSCWLYPNRSLVKAADIVRNHAQMLLYAIAGVIEIGTVIEQIVRCLATSGSKMNHRKANPNTYQLLLDLPDAA